MINFISVNFLISFIKVFYQILRQFLLGIPLPSPPLNSRDATPGKCQYVFVISSRSHSLLVLLILSLICLLCIRIIGYSTSVSVKYLLALLIFYHFHHFSLLTPSMFPVGLCGRVIWPKSLNWYGLVTLNLQFFPFWLDNR